ncbi:glyoxalase [Pseudomonas aeruginosa]|nr:glyoxalase [Pseudomonas aeruginosa]
MSDESANPSCISHLSIGTNDFPRARAFYDAVMAALGCKVILEYPGAVAYGKLYPEFWVQAPIDGRPASVGNGSHVGFFADSKAQVDAFHAAALAAGADDEGAPGRVRCTASPTTGVSSATSTGTRSRPPTGT